MPKTITEWTVLAVLAVCVAGIIAFGIAMSFFVYYIVVSPAIQGILGY